MSSSIDEARLLRRINALRRLQIETAELDGKFSLQVLKLETKYDYKLEPFLERRRQIIMGEYEPDEEESNTALTYVQVPQREEVDESFLENLKGIPGFWFTVLNNIPIFWSMIQRHDCDPLTYLTNISSVKVTQPEPGFTLQFHFAPNQYFTNEILTKQYKLEFGKKKNDPFNVYGPEMIDCVGCDIEWKSQDLTVTIKKNKIIKRASFFNFFDPPKSTGDPKLEPYVLNYLLMDFQLAYYLKERVIPKAVLYYLGEAVLRENFGFEKDITQQEEVDLAEDWPTTYDRKSILNKKYEKDMTVWEKSEKALAERLAKQKFEKAEDFEESKVNLSNLLLGEVAKEDKTKLSKSKLTEKELEDMLLGRNNPCETEIVEVLNKEKKGNPKTKNSQKINNKKKIIQPDTRNTSTVKKKKKRTKHVIETADRSSDEGTEQFVNLQKDLLSYYKKKGKRAGKSPKTKDRMEPEIQVTDTTFDEDEQFVDLQKDLLSFYNEKAKKESNAPITKQRTEPKAPSDTRRLGVSEPSLGLETLLDAYYKERTKKKPNKKDKFKPSQR